MFKSVSLKNPSQTLQVKTDFFFKYNTTKLWAYLIVWKAFELKKDWLNAKKNYLPKVFGAWN